LTIGKNQAALAILAVHPDRPGAAGIAGSISPEFDAAYARAVIADFDERFGRADAACSLLWCVPDASTFAPLVSGGDVVEIGADASGARRTHAVEAAHQRGFSHVAVMALDAPHISNEVVYTALGQADQYGVVFGAGDRGALYIVATKEDGGVFHDVRFDTEHAATDLIVSAGLLGLSCAPLVGNFVVRDADDLKRLAAYFARHKTVESHRTQALLSSAPR
jgi:hypothetical protein